jgi:uncharacterized protein (DUF427 family)
MVKAIWDGVVLAEASYSVAVGDLHYFPPDSLRREYLQPSTTHVYCPKKGPASFYHVEVNGKRIPDAAWCFANPSEDGYGIKDHIAFGRSVLIES